MKRKRIARNFIALGVPLLAVSILVSLMFVQDSPEVTAKLDSTSRSGNGPSDVESRVNRPVLDASTGSDAHGGRVHVRSASKMQPNSETGYELRAERRELSVSVHDLYRGDATPTPESLRFPLFDGQFVELKALRHQSIGKEQGVVFAEAEGEIGGGHILLSYVGTALAGMIHLPTRGEFYEIRTDPDGRSHILTQLNPEKMPVCGGCPRH